MVPAAISGWMKIGGLVGTMGDRRHEPSAAQKVCLNCVGSQTVEFATGEQRYRSAQATRWPTEPVLESDTTHWPTSSVAEFGTRARTNADSQPRWQRIWHVT
jgi:hypothetical protein